MCTPLSLSLLCVFPRRIIYASPTNLFFFGFCEHGTSVCDDGLLAGEFTTTTYWSCFFLPGNLWSAPMSFNHVPTFREQLLVFINIKDNILRTRRQRCKKAAQPPYYMTGSKSALACLDWHGTTTFCVDYSVLNPRPRTFCVALYLILCILTSLPLTELDNSHLFLW